MVVTLLQDTFTHILAHYIKFMLCKSEDNENLFGEIM